jgi:hypothetical protein
MVLSTVFARGKLAFAMEGVTAMLISGVWTKHETLRLWG